MEGVLVEIARLGLLLQKLSGVASGRCAEGHFKNKLANPHSGTEDNGGEAMVYDFELKRPGESGVNSWRCNVNANSNSR